MPHRAVARILGTSSVAALLLLLATSAVQGQACGVAVGDTARVMIRQDLELVDLTEVEMRPRYFGIWNEPRENAVALMANNELLLLPRAAVRRVDALCKVTETPGRDGMLRGALFGTGGGLIVGYLYHSLTCSENPGSYCEARIAGTSLGTAVSAGGLLGASVGALLGSFLGSVLGELRWVPVIEAPS